MGWTCCVQYMWRNYRRRTVKAKRIASCTIIIAMCNKKKDISSKQWPTTAVHVFCYFMQCCDLSVSVSIFHAWRSTGRDPLCKNLLNAGLLRLSSYPWPSQQTLLETLVNVQSTQILMEVTMLTCNIVCLATWSLRSQTSIQYLNDGTGTLLVCQWFPRLWRHLH